MIILTDAPTKPADTFVVPDWVIKELEHRVRQHAEECRRVFGSVLDADGQPYYGDDFTAYVRAVEARERP